MFLKKNPNSVPAAEKTMGSQYLFPPLLHRVFLVLLVLLVCLVPVVFLVLLALLVLVVLEDLL